MLYNIKLVTQWAKDRGLVEVSQDGQRSQFIKGVEEGGEIFNAILSRDKDELIDAIGDRLVVLTIECLNAGLDPQDYIKRVRCDEYQIFNSFIEAVNKRGTIVEACVYGSEQGLLARAIAKNLPINEHVVNLVKILNNLSTLLCVDIGECYRTAYNVIRDRTGRKVDGVFIKDE